MTQTELPGGRLLTLKVHLKGSAPSIWRRLQISDDMTLGDLHHALQMIMGWTDSHLHEFQIGRKKFSAVLPDDFDEEPENDEDAFELREVVKRKGAKLRYIYDFGDYWEHEIVVEGISEPLPGVRGVRCIEGERACPPEDCGGLGGYYRMLDILENPAHKEYEMYRDWLSKDFDPNAFDAADANRELAEYAELLDAAVEYLESGGLEDLLGGDEGEDLRAFEYEEPVRRLLTLDQPRDDIDYTALGIGMEHVPELIRMAQDRFRYEIEADPDSPAMWAPFHAWHALGQLRAEAAIEPLVGILRLIDEEEDDWVASDLPDALGKMGAPAIPALSAFLRDPSKGLWGRVGASTSLRRIAECYPETRDTCVAAITAQLEQYAENDETLNGLLTCELVELHATESGPAMEGAFAAGAVDLSIVGDWQDVQIQLGLLERRKTPRPSRGWFAPEVFDDHPVGAMLSSLPPPPVSKKHEKAKKKRKEQKKARRKNRRK